MLLIAGSALALRAQFGDKLPERQVLRTRMAGLSRRDRMRVRKAVQKGRAVPDPALAPAVAQARFTRAYARKFTGRAGRWASGLFAALQLFAGGQRLLSPTTHGLLRWAGAAGPLLTGVLFACMPLQWKFIRRRADRAEQRNLGVLYDQQEHAPGR